MAGSTTWRKRASRLLRYGTLSERKATERKRERKWQELERKFQSTRWSRDQDLVTRRYESYEEYLEHQASKLARGFEHRKEKNRAAVEEFRRRFQTCEALEGASNVLCLGARLGGEVEALHGLGCFAVGIDLEPGPGNERVLTGDFHALVFADATVDAVYTNALDHVFDLGRVVREVARVLRPAGVFVADVTPGFEEGTLPGDFEASYWRSIDHLVAEIEGQAPLREESRRRLEGEHWRAWHQLVFRKAKEPAGA